MKARHSAERATLSMTQREFRVLRGLVVAGWEISPLTGRERLHASNVVAQLTRGGRGRLNCGPTLQSTELLLEPAPPRRE